MNDLKDLPIASITQVVLPFKNEVTVNGDLMIEWRLFFTQLVNKIIQLEERIKVLEGP